MIRIALLFAAVCAGAYALASWMCGLLTDAGVAGAISATCVLAAEGISYCDRRRDERARRTRAEVWERRDAEVNGPAVDVGALRLLRDDPAEYFRRSERRAVWPHDVGSFE